VAEGAQTSVLGKIVDPLHWHLGEAEGKAYLDEWTLRLREVGLPVESVLLRGQAAEQIVDHTREGGVDLIALSTHGRSGLTGWNVSSVVQKIILRAYLPLLLVRAYQPAPAGLGDLRYRRLLLPLDCSRRSECVLQMADILARHHDADLLAVHVVHRPQMPLRAPADQEDIDLVNRLVERSREEAGRYLDLLQARMKVDVQTSMLVSESPAEALHNMVEAEGIDLVVLCAHGHSGGTRWPYGSLVANFIGFGTTPLLIVQDLSPEEVSRTIAEISAKERKGH
jgi:nucleotide-binding universal stress UspA family protein